eukprot:731955-Hanusia_phi.AAC.1
MDPHCAMMIPAAGPAPECHPHQPDGATVALCGAANQKLQVVLAEGRQFGSRPGATPWADGAMISDRTVQGLSLIHISEPTRPY